MVQQTPCSCPAVTLSSMDITGITQPKVKVSFQLYQGQDELSETTISSFGHSSKDLCVLKLLHSWLEALLAPSGVLFLQSQSLARRHTATRTRKARLIRRRFQEVWSQRARSGTRTVIIDGHTWTLSHPLFLFQIIILSKFLSFYPSSPSCLLTFLEFHLCG